MPWRAGLPPRAFQKEAKLLLGLLEVAGHGATLLQELQPVVEEVPVGPRQRQELLIPCLTAERGQIGITNQPVEGNQGAGLGGILHEPERFLPQAQTRQQR